MLKRVLIFFSIFIFFFYLSVSHVSAQEIATRYEAKIAKISNGQIEVQVQTGDRREQVLPVILFDAKQIKNQNLKTGDEVIISVIKNKNGQEGAIIQDHVRRVPLILLFLVFIAVVIFIGRKKGVLSFLGMVLSFVIIAKMIIPQILLGNDPVLISLLGAVFIIPITFYIAHGLKWQTTIAVIGTFFSLVVTGLLAYLFVNLVKLTGFAAEEAVYLQAMGVSIDIKNLLLAGIIIGALGVLDDITISQTSIIDKLVKANPKYTRWQLYREAMDVGRDHIASLVNTLILVYTGVALPLFVLFSNSEFSYGEVVNMEIVATEIVRTLVSSIGIIAAVPITTFLAVRYLKRK